MTTHTNTLFGDGRGRGGFILLLLFISTVAHAGQGLPLLIDTGIGDDFTDLYTITEAVRTTGLNLTGITTSFYNTQASARTVQKLLNLLDRPDIPVAYGDVSKGSSNLWLQWGQGFESALPPKSPACDLLIELSKQFQGELSVIATGPLTNLAAALQKEPETAKRIHHIYISGVDCSGQISSNLASDPDSAQIVFATTIPITVFPKDLCKDLVLTQNRVIRIGQIRSPLTDELLNLTYQYRKTLAGEEPLIALPGCLAVAYANTPAYTHTETKRFQLVGGSLEETGGMTGREIDVAVSTHPAAAMRELTSRLSDSNINFGTTFAHFVVGLNKLSKDALLKVQQGIKGGISIPEVSHDKGASEVFQIQALAYISGYINLLKDIDDPVAREMYGRFKDALLRIGKIGKWFPDWFYGKWCYEVVPGKPIVFDFGIANDSAQELSGVHGSVTLNDHTESVAIASSTKEIRFAILVEPSHFPTSWPVNADLKADFTYRGVHYGLSTSVPVMQAPPARITAIRCATDTLKVEIVSSSTATLAVNSIDTAQGISLQQPVSPQTEPSWINLPIEKRNLAQPEVVRATLSPATGSQVTVAHTALLPPAGEMLLVEPEGPSKSSCFAVSKSGQWGWATEYLSGVESLEFKVSPDLQVKSSTDVLYAEVDYFCEGDDLDTFRIEGATESAMYQPLTAWMTKPEPRGWRTDRLRVSPMVEAMIRSRTLRWLRIQSGQDGDEVIRSIRFK